MRFLQNTLFLLGRGGRRILQEPQALEFLALPLIKWVDYRCRAEFIRPTAIIIARYTVANPLPEGLVRDIGDYLHWDWIWLTDRDESPMVE